jgi:hypothetical protein
MWSGPGFRAARPEVTARSSSPSSASAHVGREITVRTGRRGYDGERLPTTCGSNGEGKMKAEETADKFRTALLVIDAQCGLFGEPLPAYRGDEVLALIASLARRARENRVPVIYLQHDGGPETLTEHGSEGWQIHPQVAPAQHDAGSRSAPATVSSTPLALPAYEAGCRPPCDHWVRDRGVRRYDHSSSDQRGL